MCVCVYLGRLREEQGARLVLDLQALDRGGVRGENLFGDAAQFLAELGGFEGAQRLPGPRLLNDRGASVLTVAGRFSYERGYERGVSRPATL